MTGYGQAFIDHPDYKIQIEILSVNGRKYEIYPIIPKDWLSLDFKIREILRSRIDRGKVTIRISLENTKTENPINVDLVKWNRIILQLKELSENKNIRFEPDANTLYRIAKDQQKESNHELEAILPHLEKGIETALISMENMQKAEGLYLFKDLKKRIKGIESKHKKIQEHSLYTVEDYRKQLMNRLGDAELNVNIEDERILKEIALFADRIDVSEENIRLRSHLEQFQETLEQDTPVGRRLDFLCQEIFRELNTLGNKSRSVETIKLVLDSKNELEKIREQVQNIV